MTGAAYIRVNGSVKISRLTSSSASLTSAESRGMLNSPLGHAGMSTTGLAERERGCSSICHVGSMALGLD
jgi:hypothetical protein